MSDGLPADIEDDDCDAGRCNCDPEDLPEIEDDGNLTAWERSQLKVVPPDPVS